MSPKSVERILMGFLGISIFLGVGLLLYLLPFKGGVIGVLLSAWMICMIFGVWIFLALLTFVFVPLVAFQFHNRVLMRIERIDLRNETSAPLRVLIIVGFVFLCSLTTLALVYFAPATGWIWHIAVSPVSWTFGYNEVEGAWDHIPYWILFLNLVTGFISGYFGKQIIDNLGY